MSENTFFPGAVTGLWVLIAMLYLASAVAVGGLCSYVADAKGRSGWSWFFLGIFCGIFALIAIAGTPVLAVEPYKPEGRQGIEDRLKAQREAAENEEHRRHLLDVEDRLKARQEAAEDEARRRSEGEGDE